MIEAKSTRQGTCRHRRCTLYDDEAPLAELARPLARQVAAGRVQTSRSDNNAEGSVEHLWSSGYDVSLTR